MKKNILDTFMTRTAIDASSISVFYTFTSGQNDIVWNDLYTKDEHYCEGNLLSNKIPGLSIGYTDTPSNPIAGSGHFTRNDILRIGSGVSHEGWAAFMDFGNANCNTDDQLKNIPEILLSSMDSVDAISGFSIGINNANKIFIEYNNKNEKETRTLDKELASFNVISASYNNILNQFELSYHDFPSATNESLSFSPSNYIHSNTWHVGGTNFAAEQYTGYSGYVDDFLLFNKPIDRRTRNNFSEAFFVDEIAPASSTMTSGYRNLPLSAFVNPTGIIGTEITGYDCAPAVTVKQKIGSDISLYSEIGLTGVKTGTTVEFTSSGSGLVPISVFNPEQIIHNTSEVMLHAKKYILFTEDIESDDLYEFYLFKKPKPNLSKASSYDPSRGAAQLNSAYKAGENINLYLNGVSQVSGSIYDVNELNILSNGYYDFNDYISYDKVEGETFSSGFAGNSVNYFIDKASLTDEDIYLNGQKLVSGLNYSTAGSIITLYPALPEGEMSFMAQAKNITSIETGNAKGKIKTDSVDELIWLNGVKQQENIDYFRVNECSLFDPSKKVKKQSSLLYNNNEEFFNIG
jgi:hypothetical protein